MKFKKMIPKHTKITKKRLAITSLVIICLAAGGFVFFNQPQEVEAGWWDDTWLYRKPVAIINASTAQTDFQVQITLDTATLITANTMQADCDDIRLTDINSNIIPHWMEPGTCNNASTKIWAKVPSIPASNATVYIYYGNPAAASESSVSDTFIREIAGVQGAWDMDEASWDGTPNEVVDASGAGNHGVRAGNATTATGKFNNGGTFDGTGDYVDCGTGASLEITSAITMEGWVKLNVLDANQQFFGKGLTLAGNGNYGYGVVFYSPTNKVIFDTHSTTIRDNLGYENAITDTNWHHIAAVWDGTTNANGKKIYIDGVLVNEKTSIISEIGTPAYNFRVGISGCGNFDSNGSIDGVKIYNRALSQAEITDLYGTGGDRQGYVTTNYPNKSLVRKFSASVSVGSPGTQEKGPGPVAYWSFDEGYGDTTYDSSDNSNDGTRGGGTAAYKPTWQTEDMCVSGKCLKFDGTNDYVDCGSGDSLDITDAITIEAWVKPATSLGTTASLVSKLNTGGIGFGYGLQCYTGGLGFRAKYSVSGWETTYFSVEPTTNEWSHVAATYDGSTVQLYLNGIPDNFNNSSGTIIPYDNNLVIGRRAQDFGGYFNGAIDEVRIYPYARSAAQIHKDYNAGLTGMGGGTEGVGAALGGGGSQKWMTDGLVGYWKMDEASWDGTADEVVDASGAGNHGVRAGNATTAAGKFGKGGTFDGTGDYVDVGDMTETSAQTVALWVKPDAVNVTEEVLDFNGTQYVKIASGTVSGEGFDTPTVYVDGSVASTVTAAWHHIVITTDTGFSASDVDIGRLETSTEFDGSIDDVRIYNRALSPREVRDLYNFAPGPVFHLKMDEKVSGDAQTLYDISTNENNGTTYHGANAAGMDCTIPGKFGTACEFDGVDDYINCYDETTQVLTRSKPDALRPDLKNDARSGLDDGASGFEANQKTLTESRSFSAVGSGVEPHTNEGIKWMLNTASTVEEYLPPTYHDSIISEYKKNNNPLIAQKAVIFDTCKYVLPVSNTQYHYTNPNNLVKPLPVEKWKFFKDLGTNDEILTLNPDCNDRCCNDRCPTPVNLQVSDTCHSCMEWHKPYRYIEYPYEGEMYHFFGDGVDLLVTPDHQMYASKIKETSQIEKNSFVTVSNSVNWTHHSYNSIIDDQKILSRGKLKSGPGGADGSRTRISESDGSRSLPINLPPRSGTANSSYHNLPDEVNWSEFQLIPASELRGKRFRAQTVDGEIVELQQEIQQYNGMVYDVTVNNHILLVRRAVEVKPQQPANQKIAENSAISGLRDIDARNTKSGLFVVSPFQSRIEKNSESQQDNRHCEIKKNHHIVSNFLIKDMLPDHESIVINDPKITNSIWSSPKKKGIIKEAKLTWPAPVNISEKFFNWGLVNLVNSINYNNSKPKESVKPGCYCERARVATRASAAIDNLSVINDYCVEVKPQQPENDYCVEVKPQHSTPVWSGNCGSGSSLDITDAITIEAWVKFTSLSGIQNIVSNNRTNYYGYRLMWNGVDKFQYSTHQSSVNQYTQAAYTPIVDTWYHVVVTRSGTTALIYVDGVDKTSTSGSHTDPVTSSVSLKIGTFSHTPQQYFNGSIDDVRIYNYARTQKQIIQDMNAGHPAVGSPVGSQVGYWKFDEGYGDTANDSSPHNNDGNLAGSCPGDATCPTWTNSGKFGKALSFDGGDYIDCGSNSSLDMSINDFTLETWIYIDDASVINQAIIDKGDSVSSVLKRYAIYTGSNNLTFLIADTNTSSSKSFGTLASNTWYHIVVSADRSGNAIMYVNGEQEETLDISGESGLLDGDSNLMIGYKSSDPSAITYFNGTIDEVKIYNYALTEDEVRVEYNQGKAIVLGATGTETDGTTPSFSADREYCVPGDDTSCDPPVAEWNFNEQTGASTYDTSANNNTGTITDATWTPEGKYGSALSFDGDGDYVTVADHASLQFANNFTVSAWIKPNLDSTHSGIAGKMDKYSTGDKEGWMFKIDNSNQLEFATRDNTAINEHSYDISSYDNTWIFVSGVYDGTNNLLYINGKQVGSVTNSYAPSSNELLVGASVWGTIADNDGGPYYFNGSIDAVKIYDYARTAAQVAWSYNRGGPVAEWRFDECQGNTAHDESGNGNTGTITIGANAPQTVLGTCLAPDDDTGAWYNGVDGKINSALSLDGVDDYVDCGDPADGSLDFGTEDFSVETWFKSSTGGDGTNRFIIAKYSTGYAQSYIIMQDTLNKLKFSVANGTASIKAEATDDYNDNIWHHTIGVRDGDNLYLYVDGIQVGSNTGVDNYNVSNDAKLLIGARHSTIPPTLFFNGLIDEVKIYNYALTAEQVRMDYNNGAVNFK